VEFFSQDLHHGNVNMKFLGTRNTQKSITNPNVTYLVPNIVHFIWFSNFTKHKKHEFGFVNYISVLSVYKIQKPDMILFHCDAIPTDPWWQKAWRDIPLTVVRRNTDTKIFGLETKHIEHRADLARLEILLECGGIYLDCDVIVVRSLDPLRHYVATIGHEGPPKFNAGTVLSERNGTFIRMWYDSYKTQFRPDKWAYNSGELPYQMYLDHPHLIHVEETSLSTPRGITLPQMAKMSIDWSYFYTLHVMTLDDGRYNPINIKHDLSTVGQVLRYIYYGTKEEIQE
jgi:hypothetical protein